MERVCLVNGRILVLEVSEGLKDWRAVRDFALGLQFS